MSEIRDLLINVTVDEPAGLVEMSLEDFNRLEAHAYELEAQLERLLSVATDMLTAHVIDPEARAAAIRSLQAAAAAQ